jgi:hypothetical protein
MSGERVDVGEDVDLDRTVRIQLQSPSHNILGDVQNFAMTANAEEQLLDAMTPERLNEWVESTLRRFNGMDWGVICDEDKETNLVSAKRGGMVMGQYPYNDAKDLVWLILDAGHETLTVLMPEDY